MKKLTLFFTSLIERYLPDAFVFAVFLTFLTFILAALLGDGSLSQQINMWASGMWDLNNFAMQMALILIFGSTLAKTAPVTKLISKLAQLATTPQRASLLVTLISLIACSVNWGLGLIVGALMAKEVAKNLKNCNFSLLLANAYSGFLVWHGGLSGSIPLKLASGTGDFKGINIGTISLSETIGSNLNITIFLANFILILVANFFLAKTFGRDFDDKSQLESLYEVNTKKNDVSKKSISEKIELSIWPVMILAVVMIIYIYQLFAGKAPLGLNAIIFIFLFLALIFSGCLQNFIKKFGDSVTDSQGILLQFPFYAAIMSLMSKSNLANLLTDFFIQISSPKTFLFFTYLCAGILNFFVPSGGGQWAIQGPIMLNAAGQLNVNLVDTSMAIAWGDAWSNMVQPFWALPILSMAKIKMQKMMSYTLIIFLLSGLMTGSIFILWSLSTSA